MSVHKQTIPLTPEALSFETVADNALELFRIGIPDVKRSRRTAQDVEEAIDHACAVLSDAIIASLYRWVTAEDSQGEAPTPGVQRMVVGLAIKRLLTEKRAEELTVATEAAAAMRQRQYDQARERRKQPTAMAGVT